MLSFKLNILHIITKLELGGAQKSTLDIISRLDRKKYHLFLATSPDGILVDRVINIPDVDTYLIPTLRHQIDPIKDFKILISLSKYIKAKEIDIVHTHSSKAGILGRWAARIAGVSIIIHTVHGWEFHQWQSALRKGFYIFLEGLTAKVTDRLIAVSTHDIEKGQKAGIGNNGKYVLIRYGIQIGEFANRTIDIEGEKGKLGLDSNSPVIGMVACLKPQKAPSDYIRAAAIVVKTVPQTKFLLVGDGILRPEIEGLIANLHLTDNVILTGWRRDIPDIMSILDMFVLSSLWEGSPIVFLEAMASARPIVATDVDGTSELIKDGINGFLVPPGDYWMLAQRIIALLENKELARSMGQEGRRSIDSSFDVNNMVARIEDLYDGLARGRATEGS